MNNFTEEYLRNAAQDIPQGDFTPYNKKDVGKTKRYIKGMLGALSDRKSIIVNADYSSYGSGFASYINVKISKKDKSDVTISQQKNKTSEQHDGLLLYISLVAPYWCYGKSIWWDNYSDGTYIGGGGSFLEAHCLSNSNELLWQNEINFINSFFDEYQIRLLTNKEAQTPLWFDVKIKSNLAEKQLQVFDCFYHWED